MVNAKAALKTLWNDTATITEYRHIENADGSTGLEEVVAFEGLPCKLSFTTLRTTDQTDAEAKLAQAAKLFLDNAVEIKPGSKITVQHSGRTLEFAQSGLPGVFTSHQEISLVPFERYA